MADAISNTPPSESEKPDAVLLALEEFLREAPFAEHLAKAHDKMSETADRQICEIPAQSFAGIAVKLRNVFEFHMNPDPRTVPFEDLDWDKRLLVRALEDAERLAGGAA